MRGPARLLLLAGAVGIGLWLFRAGPRDLTLVYGLPFPATAVEVEVLRGEEPLRRAELRLPAGGAREARHALRLPDGAYRLRIAARGAGVVRRWERPLQVSEDGPVVLPLGD